MKQNIIKTTKNMELNIYNGLTRKEGFDLEKDCLLKINSNFKCICSVNKEHFPKLISFIPNEYKFVLSNCGKSIYELNNNNEKINIKKMKEQINCIIYNLKQCKIKHLDIDTPDSPGKNICVNDKGVISLIDFDIASINNNYKSEIIKNRNDKWYGRDYDYNHLRKKLTHLISLISNNNI